MGSCELPSSSSLPSLSYGPGFVTIYESPPTPSLSVAERGSSLPYNITQLGKKKHSSLYHTTSNPKNPATASPLMESLDLPKSPLYDPSSPSRQQNTTPSKKVDLGKAQSPSYFTEKGCSSPQSSRRLWFPRRNKLPNIFTSTSPTSPKLISRSSGGRLMESLNLEQPLSRSLSNRSGESTRNSIGNSPDTNSEMDFETTFSDVGSIKSEYGDSDPTGPPPSSPISSQKSSPTHQPASTRLTTASSTRESQTTRDRRLYGLMEALSTDKKLSLAGRAAKRLTTQSHQRTKLSESSKAPLTISSPKGVTKAMRRPPGKKAAKGVFLLRYTGGEGAKEGYYREVTVDLPLTIKPTLIFNAFYVKTVKG